MEKTFTPQETLYQEACAEVINDFLELLEISGEKVELSELDNRSADELQKGVTLLNSAPMLAWME
jgi:hypothetical protein